MEEGLKRGLTVAGAKAAYDEHVKQILARKIVLAHLLVGVVPEYAGMEQMCNLSEAIEEEALQKGLEKGRLEERKNTERERRRAEEESRRAEQESRRAEQESRRAEKAEAELARLKLEVNRLKRSISL